MEQFAFPRYEDYKPSGIDWLGDIPAAWAIERIRAVTDLKSKKNQPDLPVLSVYREYGVIPKDSRDDNHNATSLDTSNYKVVEPGDLVVNKMKAWQGSMGVSEHKGIVSPAYITCSVDAKQVFPKFLHYLLRSRPYIGVYNSLSYGVRVGQWDMHYEDFKHIPLPLPTQDEQQRIANFLDQKTAEIDEAIAKKQRLIELLKEQKATLINQAVTKGLNPDVPMRDSGVEWIGEVPEHWGLKKLKHVCNMSPSKAADGVRKTDREVVFLPMERVSDSGEIDCTEKRPVKEVFDGLTYFAKDDVIVAKITPCFENGKGAFLSALESSFGFGSTEFHVLRPKFIDGAYLYRLVNRKAFRRHGEEFMVGSAGQKRVPTSFFANYLFGLPPPEEQSEIATYCEEVSVQYDRQIHQQFSSIRLLEQLKQSFIAEAVTGKIKL